MRPAPLRPRSTEPAIASRRLRALLVVISVALAVAAAAGFGRSHGQRQTLIDRVQLQLGAESLAVTRIGREPDLQQGRVLAARALVRSVMTGAGQLGRSEALDRLALARTLSAEALAERPASWGASTLLGASTYLGWSVARDNRLLMAAPAWEAPLWRATTLGPSKSEPASFLSMAYLELWPTLPESKRAEARELLARGFQDRETFERLIPAWVATAQSAEDAVSLVPAEPFAWRLTRDLMARRGDWQGYALATQSWHEVLAQDFAAGIAEAEARLAAGDALGARDRLLVILRESPIDGRYAETMAWVLRVMPAGLVDSLTARLFSQWLEWSRAQCRLGDCVLPASAIGRLASATVLAESGLPDNDPARSANRALAAEMALYADRLDRAEQIERETERGTQGAEWASYRIAKSRLLVDRGHVAEARQELERIDPSRQNRAAYWLARAEVEAAAGDETATAWTREQLERQRVDRWPAAAWSRRFTESSLELYTAAATGLELTLDRVPGPSLAVTIRWDGREVLTVPAAPDTTIQVPVTIAPGQHLLEVEALGGLEVKPGTVRLMGASG